MLTTLVCKFSLLPEVLPFLVTTKCNELLPSVAYLGGDTFLLSFYFHDSGCIFRTSFYRWVKKKQ